MSIIMLKACEFVAHANQFTLVISTVSTYARVAPRLVQRRLRRFNRVTEYEKCLTRDERTVVDDFCVPNLTDAFHRAADRCRCSCGRRYRCRARKYARARWRHIRRFVFRGMHLSPRAGREERVWQRKGEKRKREGKKEREIARLRCSRRCGAYTHVLFARIHIYVYTYIRTLRVVAYTRQIAIAGVYVGCEVRFGERGTLPSIANDMRNYDPSRV